MNSIISDAEVATFQTVKKIHAKGRKGGIVLKSPEEKYEENIPKFRATIRRSDLLAELKEVLSTKKITHIRCLALGNFMDDTPATYQFALLLELIQWLESKSQDTNKSFSKESANGQENIEKEVFISIYDPIFTQQEKQYLTNLNKHNPGQTWSIDDHNVWPDLDSSRILYFLPHADLELTEYIIKHDHPQLLLGNHIVQHTDRFTSRQLFETFPHLSKLKSVLDVKTAVPIDDGFQTQQKPNHKRRNRRNKAGSQLALAQADQIDYSQLDTYFKKCVILCDFKNGSSLRDHPWQNAFSDLTLHFIE